MLGGSATLVPLVYYLFHTKNHEIRHNQIANARKALYLFGFARPFSRYADSRLGAFIREELRPRSRKGDETFPIAEAVGWIGYWERIRAYGEDLLQSNPLLRLHIVQGLTGAKATYDRNAPQIDHIFPRSELRRKGLDEEEINHFANFWILPKGKNQNKSNRHPAKYFEDVPDGILKAALIERKFLDYRRYRTFVRERTKAVLNRVEEKLDLSEEDFDIGEE